VFIPRDNVNIFPHNVWNYLSVSVTKYSLVWHHFSPLEHTQPESQTMYAYIFKHEWKIIGQSLWVCKRPP